MDIRVMTAMMVCSNVAYLNIKHLLQQAAAQE